MRRGPLHIVALTGFAVAQPVYDLLARHADFFVAHASTPGDLLALVTILSVALPGLLIAIGAAVARLLPSAADAFVATGVGALSAAIGLQLLDATGLLPPTQPWLAGGAALGLTGIAAQAYRRFAGLRSFLALLSPAALVFPILFLFFSPVRELMMPGEAAASAGPVIDDRAPVVVVVFDELPLVSLLAEDGAIDAARYPGFSRLAGEATWFRNATTVAERTQLAIPALLTGRYPEPRQLATARSHPHNLFTLFARSHRFSVFETHSSLCPQRLCGGALGERSPGRTRRMLADAALAGLHVVLPEAWTGWLPVVSETWADFGSKAQQEGRTSFQQSVQRRRFDSPWLHERFTQSFAQGGEGTLFFLHLGLPHVPWRYVPSGHEYRPAPIFPRGLEADDHDRWKADAWAVTQARQRHLLQVGYADRLLVEIVTALEEAGLYDAALLAIVSDHGIGLRPGDRRRGLSDGNIGEILPVPFFIKQPGQREGRIDDRNAQTIDLLPSIADALGFELPWPVDGNSLFAPPATSSDVKVVLRRLPDGERYERVELSADAVADARRESAATLASTFPAGLTGVFAIGPHPELHGVSLERLRIEAVQSKPRISLDRPTRQLQTVDLDSAILPLRMTGRIESERSEGRALPLAIALNGTLVASTWSSLDTPSASFSAMLPESALSAGSNTLEIFVLAEDAAGVVLLPTWVDDR